MILSGLNIHLNLIKISQKTRTDIFSGSYVQCPEKLHDLHNGLPVLPERIKIEKVEKLAANLHEKKNMLYT